MEFNYTDILHLKVEHGMEKAKDQKPSCDIIIIYFLYFHLYFYFFWWYLYFNNVM